MTQPTERPTPPVRTPVREGIVKKGGVNQKPVRQPPPPPTGQGERG